MQRRLEITVKQSGRLTRHKRFALPVYLNPALRGFFYAEIVIGNCKNLCKAVFLVKKQGMTWVKKNY